MPRRKKYSPRELMEMSIEIMRLSKPEHTNKTDPKVGAILATTSGIIIKTAFRGELRKGDHAEYTLIERKLKDQNLDGLVLYTTLEPCIERKKPKCGCSFRITNARISKVFIGHFDPDPTVAGDSIAILKNNGVEIEYYDKDLEKTIEQDNQQFFLEAKERAKLLQDIELGLPLQSIEKELDTYDFTDFSEKALKEFTERMGMPYKKGSKEFFRILNQLRIINVISVNHDSNNIIRPTKLGVLLFASNPQNQFPHSIVKFKLQNSNDDTTYKDFDGPLLLMPENIQQYLKNILPSKLKFEEFQREIITQLPIQVFRETIINAIVHRNYDLETLKIKIYLYHDKLEIHSPGVPLDIPLEKFNSFIVPSIPRNPKIAAIFNIMNLVEENNIGMDILKSIKSKYGLPNPVFRIEGDYLILTIFLTKIIDQNKHLLSELNKSEQSGFRTLLENGILSSQKYSDLLTLDVRTARRHLNKFVKLGLALKEGRGSNIVYKVL
jgi:ATP-dependent DNA helicase RecG